ncbi:hypothetical protein [Dactylosporangium sp. NPDC048998]|uniref:hypothetical protein n=1 Tax=Dactylosporangium sp. NPDC048998 TaxID=3363976 RepID=UPI00371021A5
MSKHPPHHPTNPNPDPDLGLAGAPGEGRPLVDLVAGDPPVPITVWRTARASGDRGASMPARLARRLVAAYSRPGEVVVDLTDDHVLTTACSTGARRHHRAWFTDVASLIVGPATATGTGSPADADDETDTDHRLPYHGARPARAARIDAGGDLETDRDAGAVSLADWFGDDLSDAQLPPHGPPVSPVPEGVSLTGLTSLAVATWPLDPDPAAGRVRLAWLLAACRELLRPGGCLVLVVAAPAGHASAGQPGIGQEAAPEDFSPIVTAAARAGLGYLQHIAAVAADISGEHGDAFVYHVDDEELLTLARARATAAGQQWTVAHLRVHADLLVFTPATPHKAAPRRHRRDGLDGGERHG